MLAGVLEQRGERVDERGVWLAIWYQTKGAVSR